MTDADRTTTAIAMVATSSPRLPDAAKIIRAAGVQGQRLGVLGSLFGGKKSTAPIQGWDDGKLVINAHGGFLAVSLMRAPIPWSELEGPCATAWWWPEAEAAM